jgi:hypothetical protein
MARQFCIQVPWELWERFERLAIQEHGSTRQAMLHLIRTYADRTTPQGPGDHHAPEDDTR